MIFPHDDDQLMTLTVDVLLSGQAPANLRPVWARFVASRNAFMAARKSEPSRGHSAEVVEWRRARRDLRAVLATAPAGATALPGVAGKPVGVRVNEAVAGWVDHNDLNWSDPRVRNLQQYLAVALSDHDSPEPVGVRIKAAHSDWVWDNKLDGRGPLALSLQAALRAAVDASTGTGTGTGSS